MSTAVKIPDHGTPYRYKGPRNGVWEPCRCTPCVRAHRLAAARRALAHLSGQPPLHPVEPLHEHIEKLRASGMSNALIARRARIGAATISDIMLGRIQACSRDKAQRILAVGVGETDGHTFRSAVPSTRRIRALYALGHGRLTIATLAHLDPAMINRLINGEYNVVTATTAAGVDTAYRALAGRTGSNTKTRRCAADAGWPDPQWWEDYGHIDDPGFNPAAVLRGLKRDELAALRRADIIHLAGYGCTPEVIHQRLMAGGHDIALSTVRAVVLEHRTGAKRQRVKQAVAA